MTRSNEDIGAHCPTEPGAIGRRQRSRISSAQRVSVLLGALLLSSAVAPPMMGGLSPIVAHAKDDKKAEAKAAAEHLAIPTAPVTAEQPAGKIMLPEGTRVKLVLLDELKSNKLDKNDIVHYALLEDLRGPGDAVLIPKGTSAFGVVNEAKGGRSMGRKGKLEFTVDYIGTANKDKVPLRSNQVTDGKSRTGTVIAVSLLLTPLGLFMKGKSVTVPRGEIVEAYVDTPTTLEKNAFDNMTHHDVAAIVKETETSAKK